MHHRRLGLTTNSKIRKEFLITRRRTTTNILSLMTSERAMISRPIPSCLGGLTLPTGPDLSMIVRCDEL
ncbi:unnamed protein product [Brassica rapa subsp. trilocularis]